MEPVGDGVTGEGCTGAGVALGRESAVGAGVSAKADGVCEGEGAVSSEAEDEVGCGVCEGASSGVGTGVSEG